MAEILKIRMDYVYLSRCEPHIYILLRIAYTISLHFLCTFPIVRFLLFDEKSRIYKQNMCICVLCRSTNIVYSMSVLYLFDSIMKISNLWLCVTECLVFVCVCVSACCDAHFFFLFFCNIVS